MPKFYVQILVLAMCSMFGKAGAQRIEPGTAAPSVLPTGWLRKVQSQLTTLNDQLTRETGRYLQNAAHWEDRLKGRLCRIDSAAAKKLFAGSAQRYASLGRHLESDTGSRSRSFSGVYLPYLDSLHGSLAFLRQHPEWLHSNGSGVSPATLAQLKKASSQLQALEANLQDAEAIKSYMRQRQQQVARLLSQHSDYQALLAKPYAALNKEVYYYTQQLQAYKAIGSQPDQMLRKALTLLNRVPGFQAFMKDNSMLGGLFRVPGNYGSPQGLAGLQSKDQVAQQVQGKIAAGGKAGPAALQTNIQSAQSQLDDYKNRLNALGTGNGDMEMPNFQPNDQHTKSFWRRLEYGTNFQTSHTNYYFPMVTDMGLSLGYRLGHNNIVGIGASYKLGWGNGVQHIAFSSQGVGLRSFLQIKIKGSFSATGGLEYNYTTPFSSYQQLKQLQYWTKSGLIGVMKIVSVRSPVFRKTTLGLLWDFLSYQQVPRTQPVIFRVGYTLN